MNDGVKSLADKAQVIDTINDLFIATDDRDWPKVLSCFSSEVLFDMSSLTGQEAVSLSPQEIVNSWEEGLKPLKVVHHQAGNYRVSIDGDEARGFCNGIAFHYLPNSTGMNTRVFVGSYDFHLRREDARWLIDQFRFNLRGCQANCVSGDNQLPSPERSEDYADYTGTLGRTLERLQVA
jgi:hypothetical protein